MTACGCVSEACEIGAYAGFRLDGLDNGDGSKWQEELMGNPDLSPLDILAERFAYAEMPVPHEITQAEFEEASAGITGKQAAAGKSRQCSGGIVGFEAP
ncbi:MAG: hypothetical protein LBS02_10450 [Hungatella sp.]|jgi:hypothetical protein|nr:hypothetical protein [Hungatella sp.]